MPCVFEHLSGSKKGTLEQFEIGAAAISIGRNPTNLLRFDAVADPDVSGNHAELRADPSGKLTLRDLGSSNGTFLNGVRVTAPVIVEPGAKIKFGANGPEVRCAYEPVAAGPAPAAAPSSSPLVPILIVAGILVVVAVVVILIVVLSSGGEPEPEPGPAAAAAPEGEPEAAPDAGDVPEPDASPAKPGTDVYGDALPKGALARFGTTRLRMESNYAAALAFSPKGKILALGDGKAVRLIDVATGKEVRRLPQASAVDEIAFAPDGKRLLVATEDGPTYVWDIGAQKVVKKLSWAQKEACVVSPIAVSDEAVALDVGMVERRRMRVGGEEVVALSPATGRKLHIRNLATGDIVASFDPSDTPAAFSPDGAKIVTSDGKACSVFEIASKKKVAEGSFDDPVAASAFLPDGRVATAFVTGAIRIWDPAEARAPHLVPPPKGFEKQSWRAAFAAGGKFAVLRSDLVAVVVDAAAAGREIGRFGAPANVRGVALAQDGTHVALFAERYVRVFETKTGRELHSPAEGRAARLSADGSTLAIAHDESLRVFDVATRKLRRTVAAGIEVRSGDRLPYALSADGKVLAAVSFRDGRVHVHDLASGKELCSFEAAGGVSGLALSPRGKAVALVSRGAVLLHAAETGKQVRRFELADAQWLEFSPDGKVMAVVVHARGGPEVALMDATNGAVLRRVGKVDAPLEALAFSSDGKRLAVRGPMIEPGSGGKPHDASVHVLDVASGEPIATIAVTRGDWVVRFLGFTADGETLVVGTGGPPLQSFDAASGEPRAVADWPDLLVDGTAGGLLPDGSAAVGLARYRDDRRPEVVLWDLSGR